MLTTGGFAANLALLHGALREALADAGRSSKLLDRWLARRFPSLDRGNDTEADCVFGGESMARIEQYRFGHIVVDGEERTRDVIVLPDRVLTGWWRADGHRLALADIDDVIDELPERLLIGTGAYGQMRPDPETLNELRRRGVEVEALPTNEAVRRYGELDPRRTAAALHLTC